MNLSKTYSKTSNLLMDNVFGIEVPNIESSSSTALSNSAPVNHHPFVFLFRPRNNASSLTQLKHFIILFLKLKGTSLFVIVMGNLNDCLIFK